MTTLRYPKPLSVGVTLIELVIGMLVMAIALTVITGLLAPQAVRSIDPIYQVRATELAQSMFNEIMAKSFDENSDRSGTGLRCGESGASECTDAASLGPEESDRADYDDVDDYNGFIASDSTSPRITNSMGDELSANGEYLYAGFSVQVAVSYASANDKLINLVVTTPSGQALTFSSYRSNY